MEYVTGETLEKHLEQGPMHLRLGPKYAIEIADALAEESAILIEFDFEGDTARQLGMPEVHSHG